ncbi:hypothetical protein GDO86_015558 [Hymenochirus boettgeri]|uniref:Uncharacterized protein n=1 Tax=Hymenochirus boettgeri TaxID=247094 RepID=A0A8T2JYR9_9PIPI|nr:hypothetical protein GDO86_015558 [Hymenochirus boettgeri]
MSPSPNRMICFFKKLPKLLLTSPRSSAALPALCLRECKQRGGTGSRVCDWLSGSQSRTRLPVIQCSGGKRRGQYKVQSPQNILVAEVGYNVSMPCTLIPPLNALGLEVRWFHGLFNPPVYLLRDGQEDKEQQSTDYRGRVSLQNGPHTGDLTLFLSRVRISDAGKYNCFVENKSSGFYEETSMQLNVIGVGSLPRLTVSLQEGSVLLSFSSSDWYPEPQMLWKGEKAKHIAPEFEANVKQSDGLIKIESNILLRDSHTNQLYCGARHPITGKEVGIYLTISEDLFPRTSPWVYAFLCSLLILIVGAVVTGLSVRKLLHETAYFILNEETAYPELSVSDNFLTLYNKPPEMPVQLNEFRFEVERCCLGDHTFSSGCHYWEVELVSGEEWAVGVASPDVRRKGAAYMFSPQENIWCVCRFVDTFKALDAPEHNLDVKGDYLKSVGVYLKLSTSWTISFYNPSTWRLLYTFHDISPRGKCVLPFFWLGIRGGAVRVKGIGGGTRIERREDVEEEIPL